MLRLNTKGMTLIEILVVMGILIVLATIISYSLRAGRDAASRTQCLNNIRSLGQATLLYAQENPFGKFPYDEDKTNGLLFGKLYNPLYFNDLNIYVCSTRNRYGPPTNPGTTAPYTIQPQNNPYRYVLNETGTDAQTLSYPSMNIIIVENYSDKTTLSYSESYNHGNAGTSVFLINGKTQLSGSKDTAIPSNYTRGNKEYRIKPDTNLAS